MYVAKTRTINVGPGKSQKLINVGPTSIPEARVCTYVVGN